MTDTLTRDPNDSDEFPLGVGEERTVILRRDTTREVTQNLGHEIAGLPPRRRPAADETVTRMRLIEPALGLNHHDMSRVIEIDDTVTFRLAGPQSPPPPLPPNPRPSVPPKHNLDPRVAAFLHPEFLERAELGAAPDMAAAQPIAPLGRVAGADETQVQSILHSLDGGRADVDGWLRPDGYVGRHRDPLDRIAVQGEAAWGRLVEAAKPGGEPRRLRVQVGVGAFIAFAAAVSMAVLAVFW